MRFEDVVGQQRIKEKLVKSFNAGKVSHAQLFLSPEGAGGLPLALAFAQYLHCQNPGEKDACGECDACSKVGKLIHPDLHFSFPVFNKDSKKTYVSDDFIQQWREAITQNPYLSYFDWLKYLKAENKQGNIPILECREIIKKLTLKPFEGGNKVLILWMPERLGKEGNALLKVLEEPPPDTYFILVAENSELILNTILSRAHLMRIPPLPASEIGQGLQKQLEISASEAQEVAQLADGNYRVALSLAKAGENEFSEKFIEWMRMCFRKNGQELIQWTNQMAAKGREEQKNFLEFALQMLEELFLLREGLKEERRIKPDDWDFAEKFSAYINEDTFLKIYDAINKAHYHIERNAGSKIVFFQLSLQLNRFISSRQAVN